MKELLKKFYLHLVTTAIACFPLISGAPVGDSTDLTNSWLLTHPVAVLIISSCVLLLTAILLAIQCGGCTEMEVGTDSHPAAGGDGKPSGGAVTFSSPLDINGESNTGGAGLPYSLNPNVNTTPGFAGYQTVGGNNIAGYGQGGMQTAGGYQAPMSPSTPAIQTQGYQVQSQPDAPTLGPHAHRPAVEPPPPSYNESVGRGWITRPQ
ncbi:uncharacterized protein LOC132558464 isoform X2 [Ylistrum balloti]|nr:uncharacterized protein LOC132558464 isoform X2 [Ylistrum balloti]